MILTIAEIHVRAECGDAFVEASRSAIAHVLASPGCPPAKLNHSVKDPCRYLVITVWDSIESHTEQPSYSEHFVRWRSAVSEYFDDPPMAEHVTELPHARGES